MINPEYDVPNVARDFDANPLYQGDDVYEFNDVYYPVESDRALSELYIAIIDEQFGPLHGLGHVSVEKAVKDFTETAIDEAHADDGLSLSTLPLAFPDVRRGRLNSQGEISDYWDVN
ncbi:MAG TPA: hypothetical protein DDW71_00630 [Lactobacillus sp.]|nr:hypothetical protein [Lactobacillus sp.]